MTDDQTIAELRALFPVVDHWTYLHNGSVHACPTPVADAMRGFLDEWQRGGEAALFSGIGAFLRLREKLARLIGAKADNIVITESTTAALNLAAQILEPRADQNVVVTDLAYMSSTYLWLASKSAVSDVRFVKSRGGKIDVADLVAKLDEKTAAVSVCAVTVASGYRFDLETLHAETGARGIPLIVDGAQAVGLVEVDVKRPPVDFLAMTASKWLMGPAGVGFLYLADRYLDVTPPTVGWLAAANVGDFDAQRVKLHHGGMRFQGGIPNLVGVVGAEAALDFLERVGRPFIERRVRDLTTYALEGLEKLGLEIWTPRPAAERAGIVFFRAPEAKQLQKRLRDARIYCGLFLGGIRIDPNFYNTHAEIDRLLEVVAAHLKAA